MKLKTIRTILVIVFIITTLFTYTDTTEARKQTPLPYHFQNAHVYREHGKTRIEWYNIEPGRYSIYEYRYVRQANGTVNFEPQIVWSRYLRVGNVRVGFNRKGIRWKVIYSGSQ